MEIPTMGKVVVPARIENWRDVEDVARGSLSPDDVRAVEVEDALVDTGATMLSLPSRLVGQLGVSRLRSRTARTTAGVKSFTIHGPVRLTIQGRECITEISEIPDDCPVLIGQIPLEMLDFVVDPLGQRLLGNPDHGGQQMIDMF